MQPQGPYGSPLPGQGGPAGNGQVPPPGQASQLFNPPNNPYTHPSGGQAPQPSQLFQPGVISPATAGMQAAQQAQPAGPAPAPYPQAQIPGQPQQYEPVHPPIPTAIPAYQPPASYQNRQPNTPSPPPLPAAPTTPYDFFMKSPQKHGPGSKAGAIPFVPAGKANSKGFRIAMAAGGVVALLLVAGIVQAMLPKDQTGPQLIDIAATQTEISRVADLATSQAKDRDTRNFSVTSSLTVTTDKLSLLAYMKKNHFAYKDKQLTTKRNPQTDASLKSASTASNYDSSFIELYTTQLKAYESKLKQQLATTTGPNLRQILNDCIDHIELLITQSTEKS